VPQRTHRANHNDSPRPDGENRIVRKCMAELGISGEGLWQTQEGRWRQQQGRLGSERNSLAPQVQPCAPNERLENRNGAAISVLLTGRGVSEIRPGIR